MDEVEELDEEQEDSSEGRAGSTELHVTSSVDQVSSGLLAVIVVVVKVSAAAVTGSLLDTRSGVESITVPGFFSLDARFDVGLPCLVLAFFDLGMRLSDSGWRLACRVIILDGGVMLSALLALRLIVKVVAIKY